jgi:hypothetical protein
MKRFAGLLVASVFGLMLYAVPAHAQFSGLPNETAWNQYLANHPKTAEELQANPSLIYNSKWRSKHPHFEEWVNNHPKDWEMMRSPAPWQNRYGAWDKGEWHDQDWYYKNNPQWAHENHPDWWENHKDWKQYHHEEQREEHAQHEEEKHEEHVEHAEHQEEKAEHKHHHHDHDHN